jgi:hypothetical protein
MHTSVFSMRTLVAVAALALSATASAAGQDAQAGQTAFKDPVTGKMRNPTAAEAKQLNDLRAAHRASEAAARKASGAPQARVIRLQQNGIVAAHVDEESISYSVVRRNAAGELEQDCVTGASAAVSTMSTPVTTQAKEHQNEVQ